MIVYKNKTFIASKLYPDTDFVGGADWVLDDNDERDAEIEEKIISMYPNFDFITDNNGNLVGVVETVPQPEPEKPPEPPTNAELAAAIAELAEVMFNG